MPYNYASAFKPPIICKDCRNALAVAAVTIFHGSVKEKVKKLLVDPERKTVICVSQNYAATYTWDELGFIECRCQASEV